MLPTVTLTCLRPGPGLGLRGSAGFRLCRLEHRSHREGQRQRARQPPAVIKVWPDNPRFACAPRGHGLLTRK
jgi:hypothetical protein